MCPITHDTVVFRGQEDECIEIEVEAEILPAEPDVGLPKSADIISAVNKQTGEPVELDEYEIDRIIAAIVQDN